MIIRQEGLGTDESFSTLLRAMTQEGSVQSILVLGCAANPLCEKSLAASLKACPLPVFGGLFPAIVHDGQLLEKGTILVGLRDKVDLILLPDLGHCEAQRAQTLASRIDVSRLQDQTCFAFLSGLSPRISPFIHDLFDAAGPYPCYIGGGAGSMNFEPCPCVLSNEGVFKDGAVLALSSVRTRLGVAHGFSPVAGPFKVTQASGRIVHTLNWHPALEVYDETLQQLATDKDEHPSFFQIAKAHPLGLMRAEGEITVRDVVSHEGSDLVCVGDVPTGAYVHILHGHPDSLIEGAQEALSLASGSRTDASFALTLLFDCISRKLFLGEDFARELSLLPQDRPSVGALTIGEIANAGKQSLDFYNKTCVIGLLEE